MQDGFTKLNISVFSKLLWLRAFCAEKSLVTRMLPRKCLAIGGFNSVFWGPIFCWIASWCIGRGTIFSVGHHSLWNSEGHLKLWIKLRALQSPLNKCFHAPQYLTLWICIGHHSWSGPWGASNQIQAKYVCSHVQSLTRRLQAFGAGSHNSVLSCGQETRNSKPKQEF